MSLRGLARPPVDPTERPGHRSDRATAPSGLNHTTPLSNPTHWTAQMLRLLASLVIVWIAFYATVEATTRIVRAFL